jgi:hypothetical protein
MTRTVLLLLAISSLPLPAALPVARAAVVEIPASRDATLFDLVADTLSASGSGPHIFAGENSQGNTRRALLRFDVTDSVPAGSTITGVELRLVLTQANNATAREMGLHRVAAEWGEGPSVAPGGTGAAPEPGDATWRHRFFPDVEWAAPGGDFAVTPSATLAVAGNGDYTWTGPGLIADVQGLLDDPATHFGWLLRGDESLNSTVKRFNARENGDAPTRPRLVVTFTPPDVPVRAATWGRVKALLSGAPAPASAE